MSQAAEHSVPATDRPTPVELAVRIGILALWATWCVRIIHPLLPLLVWAVVIAVAVHPAFLWISGALGGRPRTSAALLTGALLLLLVAPVTYIAGLLVSNVRHVAARLAEGGLALPAPPEGMAEWPLVGPRLASLWAEASSNTGLLLEHHQDAIRTAARWLVEAAAGGGLGVVEFIVAVVVAGVLLVNAGGGHRVAQGIARRLAGERGPQLADLAEATVRGVARGLLGVAVVQSLLAGGGMVLAGVPAAGLWTLLCLFLCVVQIGAGLVLVPAVIYVFVTGSTTTAVLFLVWSVFVMLIDNVLKPMLMGRGLQVPMVVVFLGAIGGMLAWGIVGLFVGSVILVLGYKLFVGWLAPERVGLAPPGAPAA
jgi:predicted PurR-regulated permease PerM